MLPEQVYGIYVTKGRVARAAAAHLQTRLHQAAPDGGVQVGGGAAALTVWQEPWLASKNARQASSTLKKATPLTVYLRRSLSTA